MSASDQMRSPAMRNRVISRSVLRDQVRERLMADILGGSLVPGARLVEMRIARELGVSQAPVREAFRDLELLGFIVKSAFRGARVRRISLDELAEIYPIRAAVEGVAARAAATHADNSVLAHLEELLAAMREAARLGDDRAQAEADVAFHQTIIEASGNRLLRQFWEAMRLATTTFLTILMTHRPLPELAERHVPILDALRAGEPATAEEAMRRHIEEPGEWVRAAAQQEAAMAVAGPVTPGVSPS